MVTKKQINMKNFLLHFQNIIPLVLGTGVVVGTGGSVVTGTVTKFKNVTHSFLKNSD